MEPLPVDIFLRNPVYTPSSDTFCLSDAIIGDISTIIKTNPTLILEVGCGSGYISTNLAKSLKSNSIHSFTINCDLNPFATKESLKRANLNNVAELVDAVNGSMVYWTSTKFDIIIFNPPYVPCQQYDHECSQAGCDDPGACVKKLIELSYNGGPDGNLIINEFLATSLNKLSDEGYIYLLLEKRNCPDSIIRKLQRKGYVITNLLTRRSYNEIYTIIRIGKK